MAGVADGRSEWQRRMGVGERQNRHHVHAGTVKVEPIRREDNGRPGGHYTHRMDGSNDCTVYAPPILAKSEQGRPA